MTTSPSATVPALRAPFALPCIPTARLRPGRCPGATMPSRCHIPASASAGRLDALLDLVAEHGELDAPGLLRRVELALKLLGAQTARGAICFFAHAGAREKAVDNRASNDRALGRAHGAVRGFVWGQNWGGGTLALAEGMTSENSLFAQLRHTKRPPRPAPTRIRAREERNLAGAFADATADTTADMRNCPQSRQLRCIRSARPLSAVGPVESSST